MKLVLAALILAALILGVWGWSERAYLRHAPDIISAYYAKQFCSCYYVMEQSADYCHRWTEQWIPISRFENDETNKRVKVAAFLKEHEARWLGPRKGCRLVSSEIAPSPTSSD